MDPGCKRLPHNPPLSLDTTGAFYLINIATIERGSASLLDGDTAQRLLDSLRFYHAEKKWWIHVAVIMPDHLHFIASFNGDMAITVRNWKKWSARNFGIPWQIDFFDHRLRNEQSLAEKSDYLLQNPVRAGLVPDWRDWPHFWIGE